MLASPRAQSDPLGIWPILLLDIDKAQPVCAPRREASLEPVDGLISGPPCPPWSTTGNRRGCSDERSLVWDKVCQIIVDQAACKRSLLFFMLENVRGMDMKARR